MRTTCIYICGPTSVLVYVKPLEDGSKAVGIFNLSDRSQNARISFTALHIVGPQLLRDLWRQKDLGLMADCYDASIARHGVVMLKFVPQR